MNNRKRVKDSIEKSGRMVLNVFGETSNADGFSYTIGNTEKGLPELLITGLFEVGQSVLNDLSEMMIKRGRKFDHGEIVSLGGEHPVTLIDASDDAKTECTIQVGRYYGDESYRLMQVVFCDPQGRFPWDERCMKPYRDLKVFRAASH